MICGTKKCRTERTRIRNCYFSLFFRQNTEEYSLTDHHGLGTAGQNALVGGQRKNLTAAAVDYLGARLVQHIHRLYALEHSTKVKNT